jgi:hypothetical protein
MASILSLQEYKAAAGISDTTNDPQIQRALNAATRVIEFETGRKFELSAADETRYYYANADGTLDLVDLVTVTSIAVDTVGDRTYATALATTDYELRPLNDGRYSELRIWPTSSKSFSIGRRVRIIGKFGYVVNGAAPDDVKQACFLLAQRYFLRKDAPFGVLQATDLGQFERLSARDPDVVELLKPYVASSPSAGFVVV